MRGTTGRINVNIDATNFVGLVFVNPIDQIDHAFFTGFKSRHGIDLREQATQLAVILAHFGDIFIQVARIEVVAFS